MSSLSKSRVLDIVDFLKENDDVISTTTLFSLANDMGLDQEEILAFMQTSAW